MQTVEIHGAPADRLTALTARLKSTGPEETINRALALLEHFLDITDDADTRIFIKDCDDNETQLRVVC
jgi:hypothetical protein